MSSKVAVFANGSFSTVDDHPDLGLAKDPFMIISVPYGQSILGYFAIGPIQLDSSVVKESSSGNTIKDTIGLQRTEEFGGAPVGIESTLNEQKLKPFTSAATPLAVRATALSRSTSLLNFVMTAAASSEPSHVSSSSLTSTFTFVFSPASSFAFAFPSLSVFSFSFSLALALYLSSSLFPSPAPGLRRPALRDQDYRFLYRQDRLALEDRTVGHVLG